MLGAIRGAVGVSDDTRPAIRDATARLVRRVMERDRLAPADVECLWFTMTPDLTADVPPLVLREEGILDVPALCAADPVWEGAPQRTIRVMALARIGDDLPVDHVHPEGAGRDRPRR
ncbi:chorismate mutase [Nocardiopsis lambiniae]|uniref:chorismate mutase n=1 Tax=Nocardiopsis lambiniae TaxID=3075539 RepID=A0ABU2M7B7_9ACTN|nr:chorismate mutase [Nocardiopsis sp. DSM 44743]MDT0328564.1 chorismate mutase [Nocardiopsis sp. DSM 44743]